MKVTIFTRTTSLKFLTDLQHHATPTSTMKIAASILSPWPAQWPWLSGSSPHGFWPGTARKITIVVQVGRKQSTFRPWNQKKWNKTRSNSWRDVKALSIGGHKFELASLDHTQPTSNSGWSILVDFDFSRHFIHLQTGTTKNMEKRPIHCFEPLMRHIISKHLRKWRTKDASTW